VPEERVHHVQFPDLFCEGRKAPSGESG
jgi:hypothetical protein